MPFYVTVGLIWALISGGIWGIGLRRNVDTTLLKAGQALVTIIALINAAPSLGVYQTILVLLWMFLLLSVSALIRRYRLPLLVAAGVGAAAIALAVVGSESLNTILLKTLALLVLTWVLLLGLNLGFSYLLRRIAWMVPVLFAVTVITFGVMHAVPGGPFDSGGESGGIPLTPEVRANLMRKYHLDKPLYEQYVTWLWSVLHGDFGFSFQVQNSTCQELIARAWPVSVHLGGMALIVALVGGLTLGILAAMRQNTWVDYVTSLLAIFSIVTPSFVLAVGLILIFSLGLHWFDTGGWSTPKDWVMPVIAMSLGNMAAVARYTRASMIDAIRADYVRTARAKGLSEHAVVIVHVLKNALIPLLTIAGPMAADLITGSFFIETIFRIPGLGKYFTTSVFARDYPMIMANALLWSTLIVVVYFITDLLYALVDPRIRYRKD